MMRQLVKVCQSKQTYGLFLKKANCDIIRWHFYETDETATKA